jgi:thioredoxin-related protein
VFVDTNGELITKLPGYSDAETFLYALRFVRTGSYATQSFREFMDAERGIGMPAMRQAAPDVRG